MENIVEFVDSRIERLNRIEKEVGSPKRWATKIAPTNFGRFKVVLAVPKGKRARHILIESKDLPKFRLV